MRWEDSRQSSNVEDRRGMSLGRGVAGGGIGIVIVALIAMFMGVDPSVVLGPVLQGGGGGPMEARESPRAASPEEARLAKFASAVLAETEDAWKTIFQRQGRTYQEPVMVLFSGAVQSNCGLAQAAMGPFYCPLDRKLYLDLDFFKTLDRMGGKGDFAQAYVIAHEVGHHVQNQLGILPKVQQAQQRLQAQGSAAEANRLSVMAELQADCFAGIWAQSVQRDKGILEPGDVEEAMQAAASVGDDRIQRQHQGYVVPDSFTHGSSRQRMTWFMQGFKNPDINSCNTFEGSR